MHHNTFLPLLKIYVPLSVDMPASLISITPITREYCNVTALYFRELLCALTGGCVYFSSVRKNVNGLHQCLESVVVPMFCNTMLAANQEQKAKLNKVCTRWRFHTSPVCRFRRTLQLIGSSPPLKSFQHLSTVIEYGSARLKNHLTRPKA